MKKSLQIIILLCGGIAVYLWFTTSTIQHADMLIINAKVYTVDPRNTIAEAVAISGDRIVAVGTTSDLRSRYSSETVIDAGGRPVYPGFIDSHGHVSGLGESLIELNLTGTTSVREIAAMVEDKAASAKPGAWIRGRGWDQNRWSGSGKEKPFPTAAMLDKASPRNPVVLFRVDGHAVWLNSLALSMVKPDSGARELPTTIEGGRIVRDKGGKPTGVFIDNAVSLVIKQVPDYTKDEIRQSYALAFKECLRYGLTSIQDMGIDEEDYGVYRDLLAENLLPIRVYAAIGGDGELWQKFLATGPFVDRTRSRLVIRAVKMYIDGALGSRGAALIEPYSDDPGNRGLTVNSAEAIRMVASEALGHGFQICTHAIGDRGNNIVLNAYEEALRQNPKAADPRLRIEHAQVLDPADIHRFKQLGVIPSMQPTHCTSDMYWAQARLGPVRIRGAYAWRSLLDDGNIIPAGSDFPVESPDPLAGFYAAITRQDKNGIPQDAADVARLFELSADGIKDSAAFNGGWYAAQRMTREEALKAFTIWGAYSEFAETQKGSIEKGKLADLVILSDDIMRIPPKEILTTKVLKTIVGGKVEYSAR
ncbi:MAG TPA: amidohydrolase [Bacteroidota bacterium]|nr:amidohydrolase [Bacteroidota bacterium]